MQCLAQHFVRRVNEICRFGGSDLDIAPFGVIDDDHIGHAGEQGAQFDLGQQQRLLRLFAAVNFCTQVLRDVSNEEHDDQTSHKCRDPHLYCRITDPGVGSRTEKTLKQDN